MKALFALLFAVPMLVACNTIAGVGKDVESAGKVVKETAEDVKDDLSD
ncbi:MAG: entericidin A/B family lipoprotein [Pseudomonadota bacterium]